MLEAEVTELLRELLGDSGAAGVHIGPESEVVKPNTLLAKLGSESALFATFASPEPPGIPETRREMLEKAARAIRACMRKHEASTPPRLALPNGTPDQKHLILARIQQFLEGLVGTSELYQAVLWYRGRLVGSAVPVAELDHERMPLLTRQIAQEARRNPDSSHGELVRDDVYGRSFWHDAYLVAFGDRSYSVDFIRHRSKQVCRELTHLLNLLDDGPDSPAKSALPPTD